MPEPEAAVAIVHARYPEDAVLLMRRTEREGDSWSGHWAFPGGRRDPCDTDLLGTALRELEEECGIRLPAAGLEAALPPRLARRAVGPYLRVAPFVFGTDGRLSTVLDQGEAAEAVWVPLDFLRDPTRHRLQPVPGRPPEMRFPAIALNGAAPNTVTPPLWGFTYRLLTDWLGMAAEGQTVEQAGLAAAHAILEFLLAHGMTLRQDWHQRTVGGAAAGPRTVWEAALAGPLPAAAVLEHFCRPGRFIHSVNLLEVGPDSIRVVDAAFEEYLLRRVGPGPKPK